MQTVIHVRINHRATLFNQVDSARAASGVLSSQLAIVWFCRLARWDVNKQQGLPRSLDASFQPTKKKFDRLYKG